jgi:hypothetical protein
MISLKPIPFIFVHIPRCGGTSIEQALIPQVVPGKVSFGDLSDVERCMYCLPNHISSSQHSKIRRYARQFALNDFFKFAMVRNPWDRIISQVSYLRDVANAAVFREKSLKEQIWYCCNSRKSIWGHDLGASQVDYLTGPDGTIEIDFVGRFETLVGDFQRACKMLGLAEAPALPHVSKSQRREHYSKHFDPESAKWVAARFARDIEYFGYKFEQNECNTVVP